MTRDPIERLLTHDELRELTGFAMQGRICQALTAHGIRYITRRDGWPATTWAAVNAALGGTGVPATQEDEPDLAWMAGG